jgi:hypothetical protein
MRMSITAQNASAKAAVMLMENRRIPRRAREP